MLCPLPPSMQSWAVHLSIATCNNISRSTLHGRGKGGFDIEEFRCRGSGPGHVNAVMPWTLTYKRFIWMVVFSQTPDSNFKLIWTHVLQQWQKTFCTLATRMYDMCGSWRRPSKQLYWQVDTGWLTQCWIERDVICTQRPMLSWHPRCLCMLATVQTPTQQYTH